MAAPSDLSPATVAANAAGNNAEQGNHPPYTEMISAAIVVMSEKDGSSRQAISKYIENVYNNLSPDHGSLLTQQLRRMKNEGQLVMNKHSYMLAGSENVQVAAAQGSSSGVKRKPGRPPKIQSNGGGSSSGGVTAPFDPIGAAPTMVPMGQADGVAPVKRRPGRPPKVQGVVVEAEPIAVAEPVAGAEGAVVGRRPGRPSKKADGIVGGGAGGSVLGKRARKVKKTSAVSALVGNGDGGKRGRGRPPKMRAVGLVMGQRPRGRPRAGAVARPRGRPRKTMALTVSGGGAAAAIVPVEGTGGAGRPPKMAVRRKPRKLSGKPLGRPKKDASAPIQASNQQQMASYQDLKGKLENFQSRVKNAVDFLKPYLNDEAAVGMLQGLEELALMDMCAPVQAGAETTAETAGVTGAEAVPSSDPGGPQSDLVAPLSVQGSDPPNTN